MLVAVPRENSSEECRVAASPQAVGKLINLGYQVTVESCCGQRANFPDELYVRAGATVASNSRELWETADIVLTVNPPSADELDRLKSGAVLIGFLWPARNQPLLESLKRKNITALSMDCVPRISRAQKMDALSSMANIAGYRAVIEAAQQFGSFFTGQITAAGKVPPARVLVIGAGVAGLSAIGAARGLGAIVRAFDTRAAVRDQVKSMGADFLELEFEESGEGAGGYAKVMSEEFIRAEMELFAQQAKEVDIIITTALVPGKPAPKLITTEMVRSMKPGSVIVDLAAESGGNCQLTQPGRIVREHGVSIIGYSDLPSRLPTQSSTLYANNLVNLIGDMTPAKNGQLVVNPEDQVVRGALVTHQGEITWPPPPLEPSPASLAARKDVAGEKPLVKASASAPSKSLIIAVAFALAAIGLVAWFAPIDFVEHFTVFVLACFVGWQLIWNVTPALHTPLMSVTNAISGIIIIGAMLQMVSGFSVTSVLAFLAVLVAMINVAGGFWVTNRMLGMFRKQD
jgi:NAD(P) transhydrogenase subunit alpha